ncbi:hypothetical protein NEIPOLOT_01989 [Neisseria polysaccharea ATCC 43768]|nr:hypothetical protein NEIPOLOT_01989 [Neisseria polysaccharea ATCC 43768]
MRRWEAAVGWASAHHFHQPQHPTDSHHLHQLKNTNGRKGFLPADYDCFNDLPTMSCVFDDVVK